MRFFTVLTLLAFVPVYLLAQSVQQKATPSFWLTGGVGAALGGGDQLNSEPAFSLGLAYQRSLSTKLSLIGGLGFQKREFRAVTLDGQPCFFPLGQKVINFTDGERYSARMTEVYVQLGVRYNVNRFRVGLAVLPTYQLNNNINYWFNRNFSVGVRPDSDIDVTIKSGETIDRSPIGGGPRILQYDKSYSINAELSVQYQLTSNLQAGIAFRPTLSANNLEYIDESYCNELLCIDFSGEAQRITSLGANTVLLQVGFGF